MGVIVKSLITESTGKTSAGIQQKEKAARTQKISSNTLVESSGKTRKSVDGCHDNQSTRKSSIGIPQEEKGSKTQKTSLTPTTKSLDECHDNPLITENTTKSSAGISQEEKGTESEVSSIDKLADIAKDKIQTLTRENAELKRRTLVSFPNRILKDIRNGLHDMFTLLLDLQTFTEQIVGLQEAIGAKEKEAEEMIRKVNFIASILQSSTPINIPIMNECEVAACEGILKNVSAYAATNKTTVEHIKKTVDGCTRKLEKQIEDFRIQTLFKRDGKFISQAEFNQVVDSFMDNFEFRVQSSEHQGNQQVLDLAILATARVERSTLLREFIQETIQPLLMELNETKVRVERRFIINALQIEEDYVSCKKAVEGKAPPK